MEAVGIRLFLPRLLLELGRLPSSSCPQTGVYTIGSPSFSGLGLRTALPLAFGYGLQTADHGASQPPGSRDPVPHNKSPCMSIYAYVSVYVHI